MAAVTVSTKGDQNTCAHGLKKGGGYAVFGLVCGLVTREVNLEG